MIEQGDRYRPSWIDWLLDRIEALPGPAWVFYGTAFVAVLIGLNSMLWLAGGAPFGTLDPYFSSGPVFLILGYGGIHYLDWAAARAWRTLRPATALSDEDADRVRYQLTTMPAGPVLGSTIVGLGVGIVFLVSQYGRPYDLAEEPVLSVVIAVVVCIGYVGTSGFIYHSLHQLRLIGRADRYLESIDLLHLEPLHAFSGVTAMTGVILLAIGYVAVPTNPAALSNPAVVGPTIILSVFAVACFVVPLYGMHNAIAAEKSLRLAAVNRLLSGGLVELHHRAEQRDLAEADALNKHLLSLLAERDVIARASTWPWAPDTLRGFSAAIVIPIGLWLVYRFLGEAL